MSNQFWKARSKHGRNKIFTSPDQLWKSACEYFQWVEDNPLTKGIPYQGEILGSESLMRAMTVKGLCIFLGVNSKYFNDFNARLDLEKEIDRDFSEVSTKIRDIIDTQKFEGASAGLLNASIIARDLGLVDAKQLSGTGEGGAIKTEMTTFVFTPVGADE